MGEKRDIYPADSTCGHHRIQDRKNKADSHQTLPCAVVGCPEGTAEETVRLMGKEYVRINSSRGMIWRTL
jgi:hypothetical protein